MASKSTRRVTPKKKSGAVRKVGIGLTLLGAAAAAGAYYLYGPKGAKHRRQVKGWAKKAQKEVETKVARLKQLDERDYQKIVDSVTAKYKKLKDVSNKEADLLGREFKKKWKAVQRGVGKKAPKKRGGTTARKSSRKTTRRKVTQRR